MGNTGTHRPETIEEQIAQITQWFGRALEFADRAVKLAGQCERVPLATDDVFWALAKYAENVQESLVQIDNANATVLPTLTAVPESSWRDLKGMRNRLAHKFWDIDPQILWQTITEDFPALIALLSNLAIASAACDFPNAPTASFLGKQVKGLERAEAGGKLTPRNSLTLLQIDNSGQAWAFSLSIGTNNEVLIASTREGMVPVRIWIERHPRGSTPNEPTTSRGL